MLRIPEEELSSLRQDVQPIHDPSHVINAHNGGRNIRWTWVNVLILHILFTQDLRTDPMGTSTSSNALDATTSLCSSFHPVLLEHLYLYKQVLYTRFSSYIGINEEVCLAVFQSHVLMGRGGFWWTEEKWFMHPWFMSDWISWNRFVLPEAEKHLALLEASEDHG